MFNRYRIIHFVGIGGIGMSGIAELLHNLGYEVTGSDVKESETTRRLRGLGMPAVIGHSSQNVKHAHLVVTSSAVSADNPEVIAAKERSIPVIPRAEMLAELARLKYGILVAGAHGKTTTTSFIATVLAEGGLDPTVVIGGKVKAIGSNSRLGQGEFIVAEADESDGSFLKLSPTIAVITNIDREHMEYFKEMATLKCAFLEFANKIPFYGTAVVCIENEHTREIIPQIQRKVITYGFSPQADIYARAVRPSGYQMKFEAVVRGTSLGDFIVALPGEHNVLNGLAAIATSLELQVSLPVIKRGLECFGGIQRRFEFKGEAGGVRVYDDYGHHPAEIRAVLRAARGCFRVNRLYVIFQPHRYTRTRDMMDEFGAALQGADRVFLLNIYPAGEDPIEGVTAETLYTRMEEQGATGITHIRERPEVLKQILSELRPGDVIITLGAGDVYKVGDELLKELRSESAH